MKIRKLLTFIALILLTASCVTTKKVNYLQEPSKRIPSYPDTISYEDYLLRTDDRLYIRVLSVDEKLTALLNGGQNMNMSNFASYSNNDLYTYLIDENGEINYPTLGKIYVKDLTTREVKRLLEEKLSGQIVVQGSMPNMSVEVRVVQRSFSIIGLNSGRYNINKEKVTIFEAIAMAGDLNDFADRSRIKIIRVINDSTYIKTFDVRSKDIINSEFYYVQPNDVIYVRKFPGYSFGINSVSSVIAVTASTLSFGVFIYGLVDRFILRPIRNNQNNNSNNNSQQ